MCSDRTCGGCPTCVPGLLESACPDFPGTVLCPVCRFNAVYVSQCSADSGSGQFAEYHCHAWDCRHTFEIEWDCNDGRWFYDE